MNRKCVDCLPAGVNLNKEECPAASEWTDRPADPEKGTVSLQTGDEMISSRLTVSIVDMNKSADIILIDPEGKEYLLPASIEKDSNGDPILIY